MKWFKDLVGQIRQPAVDYTSDKALERALDTLAKHDMEAHRYFPGIGNRDDPELSHALDVLEYRGYVVTDAKGNIVGKYAKLRPSTDDIAEQRRMTFRIIVPE